MLPTEFCILHFRYQFFLQLKQDILQERLECPYETAVQLSALALQCKFKVTSVI